MIWIVGATGLLGSEFVRQCRESGLDHRATGREVDVTNLAVIGDFANRLLPDWIINASGYTAVDRAELETAEAYRLNHLGPGNLVQTARRVGARLVHFSTNYVFDGRLDRDYTEGDSPCPLSVYGASKLAGENAVLALGGPHLVIRTSWLFSGLERGFVGRVANQLRAGSRVSVVDNQLGNPTSVPDLVGTILALIETKTTHSGLFHVANAGSATWFDFASLVAETMLADGALETYQLERTQGAVQTDDPDRAPAVRPRRATLSCQQFELLFGRRLPSWRTSLVKNVTDSLEIPRRNR